MSILGTSLSVLPITARDLSLGDSANYYTAVTPTPGTGVISNAGTTAAATTPSLVVFNAGLLNVYLLYLRLSETIVGGGAATKNFTSYIDQGNRYVSGGTALTTNNTNILSNTKSSVQATFGAVTASAATSNQRLVANDWFRVALTDVVGDIYEWQYGTPSSSGNTSTVATVMSFVRAAPVIVLQPQSSFVMNIWSSTFTQGISFEVQLAYAEK